MVNNSNRHGFTLVELMVTLVVTGILVGIVYGFYGFYMKTIHTSSRSMTRDQELFRQIDMVTNTLRKSNGIIEWEPNRIKYEAESGDTVEMHWSLDTLYRFTDPENRKIWFPLDSLCFSLPEEEGSGWKLLTIQLFADGKEERLFEVTRQVTLYFSPQMIREDDWGF